MKYTLRTLFCFLLLSSCYYCTNPKEEVSDHFLPSMELLKNGIVHKYYFTRMPHDRNEQPNTNVEYHYFKQNAEGELIIERYNPALELIHKSRFRIEEDRVKELEKLRIYPDDTLSYTLTEHNNYLNFGQDSARYEWDMTYKSDHKRHFLLHQGCIGDTVINGKAAKILKSAGIQTTTAPDSTQEVFKFEETEIYVQNFGLWSSSGKDEEANYIIELVEQITPETFRALAAHDVKRFAYIDFENTLDKDTPFDLCGTENSIVDYYNGGEIDAQFIGGKKPLRRYIEERLDASKLYQESGYLALRFVVNCEGKAGRFTTDEADLDFNKKEFPTETVQHLYEILASVPDWQPVLVREENRDAYTYITFKLKNGKIIDLLP